ncbi:MAG: imidazolonepropionase [Flavobacteriales bacterium]|nr:imidazolonepropionase [Flavobacteriales bacterium]
MSKFTIKNIKELVGITDSGSLLKKGSEMNKLSTIQNAFVIIENGLIKSFGAMTDLSSTENDNSTVIDAKNKLVFPSWCDSHTHLVFAAPRDEEFVDRINGLTYEEIALKGGGILNSAEKLQETSEDDLYNSAMNRIDEIIKLGTGAVEIKSGYGLTAEAEIKMLRVIKRLKQNSAITIKANFLGAHAIPKEYKSNREGYINLIINKMIPSIKSEGLAEYIDVFCETNYYTPEETDRILKAGIAIGLKPKIHVNQFTTIGGIQTGIDNNALSVDHLEVVSIEDIEALKKSKTMPTLLPSCSFFLGIPYAPAKELIDNNLPIALASDYNPGSTPSGNMNFVVSLACIKMKLTPEQAINAATINSAYAMGVSDILGSIEIGKKANIFITKEINSYAFLPYSFGSNLIETVILNGEIQKKSASSQIVN